MAVAADPKAAVPPPEPRKVLTGPELVEEIATTLKAIYPDGEERSPEHLYLLVEGLLEVHTGKRPTPEQVTAMVADVKIFKPRPKPEVVVESATEEAISELPLADDLYRPFLHTYRTNPAEVKAFLNALNADEQSRYMQPSIGPLYPPVSIETVPGGFAGGFGGGIDRRGSDRVGGGFNPGGKLKGGFGMSQKLQPPRPPQR
jgi:hypothetical protein